MSLITDIQSRADRCVKCGLCLPHCPTYELSRNESESPRGRIALIQGLAGALEYTRSLQTHLDHCLLCRACERVCPSGVEYGRLFDSAQVLVRKKAPVTRLQHQLRRIALGLVSHRRRLNLLTRLLQLYQRSSLQRLARASGLLRILGLKPWDDLLPTLQAPQRMPEQNTARSKGTEPRGRVVLFHGCISRAVDQASLDASVALLTDCGYTVVVPSQQVCCGALHLHAGEPAGALELARKNLTALLTPDTEAILYLASGCGAQLAEYAQLAWVDPSEQAQATQLADKVMSVSRFLLRLDWPATLHIAPLQQRIAVHTPCSEQNVLRQMHTTRDLLHRIPELELVELADNARCCGAGGSTLLTQPTLAATIRSETLDSIDASGADILVSSNTGCALHLAAGLREWGLSLEVLHPVTLLARQVNTCLETAEPGE